MNNSQTGPRGVKPSSLPSAASETKGQSTPPREIGGPKGLEPTRYGDWEQKGRCTDF